MNVQIGHIPEVQPGEVGVLVHEEVTTFLEIRRTEPGRGVMFHRVGPGEVVEPGPGSDVPEDSTSVDVTRFRRSVDVVDEFVVIGGIVGGHVTMPFREVAAPVEEVLVVLPDPDNGGGLFYNPGSVLPVQADLVEPFGRGVVATGFVEPVAIEDGEVDLVADPGIQGVKDGESGSYAVTAAFWVVATGELEAEVEQTFWIARRVPVILCRGMVRNDPCSW